MKPCLDCGQRNIQSLRDFFQRTSVHQSSLKRSSQAGVKPLDRASDVGAPLALIEDLFGIEAGILRFERRSILYRFSETLDQRFGTGMMLAENHER